MIAEVEAVLQDEGLLPPSPDCPVNVYLGSYTVLEFIPSGQSPIIAKLGSAEPAEQKNLRAEHNALALQAVDYPGLAPKPLALVMHDRLTVLVMEGVPHKRLAFKDFDRLSAGQLRQFSRFLIGRERAAADVTGAGPYEQYEMAAAALPASLREAVASIAGTRRWEERLSAFSRIPQHGDLAINNVGQRDASVVIFDWEDYGKILLPAFDFLILVLSGLQFRLDEARAYAARHLARKDSKGTWFATIAEALGLDAGNFLDFALITCIVFYNLKKKLGYGEAICEQVLQTIGVGINMVREGNDAIDRPGML
jgi:hypothetical protein